MGPKANPKTHKLNPNVAISAETPKSLENSVLAGEKPEAIQLTVRSIRAITPTIDHFRHRDQLRGFSRSPGGKVTNSTLVPSGLWTICLDASPGAAVLPSATASEPLLCFVDAISPNFPKELYV